MNKIQHFIWTEKYRAKNINELILPKKIKQSLQEYINQKEIPNLLLYGTAGIGKTSSAKVLINELNARDLYINASNETGIDVIRNKVLDFVSSKGISDNKKIVIFDEADSLTLNSQQSLKIIIEEFSKYSR